MTREGAVIDALSAVMSVLARNGIAAEQLRVEQASLEDAFLAPTAPAGPSRTLARTNPD